MARPLLLAVVLPALAGCGATSETAADGFSALVGPEWLQSRPDDPHLVVLHVAQARASYDASHIPGARFVAWADLVATKSGRVNELPESDRLTELVRRLGIDERSFIVIYDEGDVTPAARMFFTLDFLGLGDRAALLNGQWPRWKREKRPVTATVPKVVPTRFTPSLRPEVVASLDDVRKAASPESGVRLIDARDEAEYRGDEAGEGIQRPGHIPGAVNVPSIRNLRPEDPHAFKPDPELERMYEVAGAASGAPLILYCKTGAQSSIAYFTARRLGLDARLYDGGFAEWSARPELEVRKP